MAMRFFAKRARRQVAIPSCACAKLLAVALLAAYTAAAAQPSHPLLNRPVPEFARPDLNGRRIDLKSYRGQVVLLTFWATWCAPCQIEMPRFVKWQRRYGPSGLQIVGISMDDDAAPVRDLCGKNAVNYPIVMGDPRLAMRYGGVLGLPLTYLIDRGGRIRARFQGDADLQAMEDEMTALLRKQKSVTSH